MPTRIIRLTALIFICLALAAPIPAEETDDSSLPTDKTALEEFIKEVIRENPELIYETVNTYIQDQKRRQRDNALEEALENRVEMPKVHPYNPVAGPADAPITLIEYTDFQCPYCARGSKTVDLLMERYDGKIRRVFKNNPLRMHDAALSAAKASLAAGVQGKFWEYHDWLFEISPKIDEGVIVEAAEAVGLDMPRFEADRKSEVIAEQVAADQAEAEKLGLTGTPSFIVNGAVVRGARPPEFFSRLIQQLLREED